jgi:chromosome segregation ATPase
MNNLASKTTLFVSAFAVSCALAASTVQAANEGISATAKKLQQHEARRELSALKKYDANGNGVMDPQEDAAKKADAKAKRDAAVIKKYDANGNGVLDPEEQAKETAELKAKHDAAVLKKYDKNHNGVLDADEAATLQANEQKMQALRDAKNKKTTGSAPTVSAPAQSGGTM